MASNTHDTKLLAHAKYSAMLCRLLLISWVAVASIVLPHVAVADSSVQWTAVGPDGGSVNVLHAVNSASADQQLYAGLGNGQMYRSTTGGASWNPINNGLGSSQINAIAASPSFTVDHTIFIGTYGGGVFKSTNEGSSWSAANNGLGTLLVNTIAIIPSYDNDHTIYSSTDIGLMKSIDGGANWSSAGSGLGAASARTIAISPQYASDRTLYVGTGSGIFKSSDGGASWNPVNSGLTSLDVLSMAVSPDYASNQTVYAGIAGQGLHISTNGGTSWSKVAIGSEQYLISLYAVAGPGSGTTLLAAGFSNVLKSTDGGLTWVSSSGGTNNGYAPFCIAVSPGYATDQTVYSGTNHGVFKSTDGIASWVSSSSGMMGMEVKAMELSPTYYTDQTLFTTTPRRIQKSTDSGASWDEAYSGIPDIAIISLSASPSFAYDQTIFAGTDYGVYVSNDAGTTWTGAGRDSLYWGIPSIVALSRYTLFASNQYGFFRSTNGGNSWDLMNGNMSGGNIVLSGGIIYLTANNGIYKSYDSGATWQPVTPATGQAFITSLAISADGSLYAGTNMQGVFKSTNNGETWYSVNTGIPSLPPDWLKLPISTLATAPGNPQTIYAGTSGYGVYISSNGGASWSALSTGLGDLNIRSLKVSPAYVQDGTVFAGTPSGVYKLATAAPHPALSVKPARLSFGNIFIGETPGIQTVTISNIGNSDLTISSLTPTGSDSDMFALTPDSCSSLQPVLQPGTSCTITVTFVPSAAGVRTSDLQIQSNDPLTPVRSLPLVGTGVIRTYDLNVIFNGGGGTVSTAANEYANESFKRTYDTGTVVTLTASTNTLTNFNGWTGCSTVNGKVCTIVMNGHKRASVAFMPAVPENPAPWQNIGPFGGNIRAIAISPNYPADQTVFAGEVSGIFKSTNGGISWQAANNGSEGISVTSLAISPGYAADTTIFAGSYYKGVLKSVNGGASWAVTAIGLGNKDVKVLALSPAFTADQTLFAGTDGGMYKSIDGGDNWSAINNGISNLSITTLAVSPDYTTDRTLLAGTWNGGIFRSTDGGATWYPSNSGLTALTMSELVFSPNYNLDHTVYTASNDIYKSNDNGATWTATHTGIPYAYQFRLRLSPDYASDQTIFASHSNGITLKSSNGGTTWVPITTGTATTSLEYFAFSPGFSTDRTVFVGKNGSGVYKSNSAGVNWQNSSTGISTLDVRGLVVSPNYTVDGTLYIGVGTSSGGVYRSSDRGGSWASITAGMGFQYIYSLGISPGFAVDRILFAGSSTGGIYKSTNAGNSWTAVNNGIPANIYNSIAYYAAINSFAVSPTFGSDQTVFAGTSSGVFRSNNGGASWSAVNNGIGNLNIKAVTISPSYATDQTIIARSDYGPVYKSSNGGASWSLLSVDGVNYIFDIEFSPDYASDQTLYVGNPVYRSNDKGVTWQQQTRAGVSLDAVPIAFSQGFAADRTLYANQGGVIIQSSNGGASWDELASSGGSINTTALVVSPGYATNQSLFAATYRQGVYRLVRASTSPRMAVTPASGSFGPVIVDTSPVVKSFNLVNWGTTPLDVTAVSISGANQADFVLTPGTCSSMPQTLPAGASCTYLITFTPGITGDSSAILTVSSTDPAMPVYTLDLEATVVTATQLLSVTLAGTGAGAVHSQSGPDISCLSGSCGQNYPFGATVSLVASPAAGYVFTGWSGACTGTGSCQVTMNSTRLVTALFAASSDTIAPTMYNLNMPVNETNLTVWCYINATDNVDITGYLITESPLPPLLSTPGWSTLKPDSFTFSAPGNRYAYAWARDAAGNVSSSAVAVVNITLSEPNDTVAPTIISFLLNSGTALLTPVTAFAATDNAGVTGYLVSEDGTPPNSTDPRWSITPPTSIAFTSYGTKTVYAWAKDAAGNVSPRASTTCAVLDPLAPVDTLLTGWPANPMTTGPATFTFIASRTSATFECSLDDQAYFPCASPLNFGALANGSHTFRVRASDASSTDNTPTAYNWMTNIPLVRLQLNVYPSIESAYAACTNGQLLEIKGMELTGNLVFDRSVAVSLKGGFDPAYLQSSGITIIHGSITISDGTVTMESISII